jgi:hypothetical protein
LPAASATDFQTVAATGSGSAEAAVADVERLLDRVVHQIRTVGTQVDPALEARVQDPTFGTVRVLVAGRTGEIVRAELFVADQQTADALRQAVDRASTSHGLAGIDLRIRTEPARPDPGANRSGAGSDGGRPNSDQPAWAGLPGGTDRGLQHGRRESQGDSAPSRARTPVLPLPTIGVVRRPLSGLGALDIRA